MQRNCERLRWRFGEWRLPIMGLFLLAVVSPESSRAAPPASPSRPVSDIYHGTSVVDPYRWLEDALQPEVAAWSSAQNAHARRILDALPGTGKLRAELRTLVATQAVRYEKLQCIRGQKYCLRIDSTHQQPTLVRIEKMGTPPTLQTVVDPNIVDPTGHTTIDWYRPSPDNRWMAVSLSSGGSELGTLHVFDARTGQPTGERIANVNSGTAGGSLAWDRDSRGFYYTRHVTKDETTSLLQHVYHHSLGRSAAEDRYEMGSDLPAIAEVQLAADTNSDHLLLTAQLGDGGQFAHYLRRPNGSWTQLSRFGDGIVQALFGLESQLYVVSLHNAPRGEILELPLSQVGTCQLDDLTPIVEQSDDTIVTGGKAFWGEPTVVPTEHYLYVVYQLGGPSTIRVFDKRGRRLTRRLFTEKVAQPFDLAAANGGGDDVIFGLTSYLEPPRYLEYRAATQQTVETGLASPATIATSDWRVIRRFARSSDGTSIPMTLLLHKDTVLNGQNPCLVTGYGGYGISNEPEFHASYALWLNRHVIYVVANLRGGGEYGEQWHSAGMLTRKQNVFDDFAACLRYLIQENYTCPSRIAIMGGSNGGLLMGATLTQHPELVQAVVAFVGIYDMLRVEQSPNGKFNVTEFGSIQEPAQFKSLFSYSPYHQVVPGVRYPPTLFLTGENDPRVDPMQSRKMTARLQTATANSVPILLRTSANAGHGGGNSLDEQIEQTVDVAAFLMDQLSVAP